MVSDIALDRAARLEVKVDLPPRRGDFLTVSVLLEGPGAPDFTGMFRAVNRHTSSITVGSLPPGTFDVIVGTGTYVPVRFPGVTLRPGEITELSATLRYP